MGEDLNRLGPLSLIKSIGIYEKYITFLVDVLAYVRPDVSGGFDNFYWKRELHRTNVVMYFPTNLDKSMQSLPKVWNTKLGLS